MKLEALNLSSLDALHPILPLPMWQKWAGLAGTVVLILALYVYLGWMPIQEEIDQQRQQLETQQTRLIKNQRLAKDLPRKQAEYAKLEKQLQVALNMLPKQSQIPDLLESVSAAGKDSGLEFAQFKPQGEVMRQIYAEVPVALNISGSFPQLLTFLKRVGELPRIVDVKNLKITQAGNGLNITGQAVTYRFVEQTAGRPGGANQPRGRRR